MAQGLDVGSAVATFTIKTDGIDRAMKKVESSMSSMSNKIKNNSKVIEKSFLKTTREVKGLDGAITKVVEQRKFFPALNKSVDSFANKIEARSGAIAGITAGATAGFAGLAFGIKKTSKEASNLNESVNAVNVVFGEGAERILQFGRISSVAVGLANSEFNQLATSTGGLLRNTGMPMDELAEKTIELTKRASDMASVFNTDVEFALSAINQGLRGETEAMRTFASDVTDASLEQFRLAKGLDKAVTEMTHQEKTLLRMEKIFADTEVTAGDFQNTIGETANQQRILNAETKDSSATIGQIFLPTIKSFQSFVIPLVRSIGQWTAKHQELTKFIVIITGVITGLTVVVGGLALAIAGLTTVATAFGISILPLILIIGAIVVAIGLLVAAGLWLWKNWEMVSNNISSKLEEFKNKYKEIFIILEVVVKAFVLSFKNQFAIISEVVKFALDLVVGIIKGTFLIIKNIIKKGLDVVTGIIRFWINIFKGDFSGAFDSLVEMFKNVLSNFSDVANGFKDIGVNIVTGLWEGIQSKAGWIGEQISNFADSMKEKFKSMFDIHSPSRVMAEIGENITAGLAVGMENRVDLVSDASDKVGNEINITNNNNMSSEMDFGLLSQRMAFQISNSR